MAEDPRKVATEIEDDLTRRAAGPARLDADGGYLRAGPACRDVDLSTPPAAGTATAQALRGSRAPQAGLLVEVGAGRVRRREHLARPEAHLVA